MQVNLSMEKSIEIDCKAAELLKNVPVSVFQFLSHFSNGVICHSYVSRALTDILLKPVVKRSQSDRTYSWSYRPIAVATGASNLF